MRTRSMSTVCPYASIHNGLDHLTDLIRHVTAQYLDIYEIEETALVHRQRASAIPESASYFHHETWLIHRVSGH